MKHNPACFLASYGVFERGEMPACDGRLIRAHLIPKQLLKREGCDEWEPRSWVMACGGPQGNGGHHGMFDTARTIRVPRAALPGNVERLADELGLVWWLERAYGSASATGGKEKS
jgi:hypothetical protein